MLSTLVLVKLLIINKMKLLTKEEIESKFNDLDDRWALTSGCFLERVFLFRDFNEGIRFINRVAICANRYKHYPDIEITGSKITIRINTKKINALTAQDFALATSLDISEN